MSLRTKLLLSIGLIILVVLGTSTFIYIQSLKQNYLEALEWRSEALAQSISIDIVEKYNRHYRRLADIDSTALQALLRTSNHKTMDLYDANNEKHVAHVSVIDSTGTIITHNEKSLWDSPVESPVLLDQLQRREFGTILDGTIYHTLVPMLGEEDVYLGTVDIGVSKQLIDEKVQSLFLQSLGLLGLFLLLAFFTVSLLMYLLLTKPVKQLITVGQRLAEGNLVQIPQLEERNDEIIILQTTFNRVANYLQHVAKVASNVAAGVLDSDVRVRSEHDVLGKAVHEMLQYLKHIASVATRITEGDLTEIVQVRSHSDAFGRIIQSMTEGLHSLVAQIRISADQIASTRETISSLASHDIGVVYNVHSSVEQMMSTMMEMESSVEEVAKSMDTLSSSVEETSASVSQMTASIAHIASNTTELTRQTHQTIGSLDTTVSSLEGIVERTDESKRLAQETIQEALEGQHVVKQVMTSMETIQQTVKMSVEAITQFAQRSQDIDTILDVIRNITEQTSLLALNAAIIAAQAGAHGRGFAVVADEIKSLADGVGASTKDIAVIVQTLQQDTGRVVKTIHEGTTHVDQGMERTQQAQETLQKIITSAERSSGVITEIAGTLHDLRTSSRNVSTAMELVNTMTDDITRATNEQKIITQQINQVVEHVNDMTAEIQHATTEQLTGVQGALETTRNITMQIDQNLESSQQIVSTTDELSLQSDILLQSVDQFKLRDEDDALSSKERLSIT